MKVAPSDIVEFVTYDEVERSYVEGRTGRTGTYIERVTKHRHVRPDGEEYLVIECDECERVIEQLWRS